MIARLRGELVELESGCAIVDVGGVGYKVHVGTNLSTRLVVGEDVSLSVSTQVREDAIQLYGFTSPSARQAFEVLLAVKGVGPKLSLGTIDSLGLKKLATAIQQEDVRALTAVSGVGRRTAQRMVLELRGKLVADFTPTSPTLAPMENQADGRRDALRLALARLGYRKTEIDQAITGLIRDGVNESSLPERLSASLRILSGGQL